MAQKEIKQFLPIIQESGELGLIPVYEFYEQMILLRSGSSENLEKAKDILSQMADMNFLFYRPTLLGYLAEGCFANDMVKEGLVCIKEALKISQQTKEGFYLSRIYSTHGDLLLMDNQPVAAEQAHHQAIAIAQQQSAKWFELLAAKSLALLWQSQGKTVEAYEVLHGVYSWFTEGFDTKDMVEAKALLEELKPTLPIS